MKPLSFAINITPMETLGGLSSYKVEHGFTPRLPFETQLMEKSPDDLSLPGVFGKIRENQKRFLDIARVSSAAIRKQSNEKLNKGQKPITYKIGDLCVVYVANPGTDNWMKKHSLQAKGPCRVAERLSRGWYRCTLIRTGVSYKRHVSGMGRYSGDPLLHWPISLETKSSGTKSSELVEEDELNVVFDGKTLVAVLDSAGDSVASLAVPIILDEDMLSVEYYGTRARTWAGRFKKVHIEVGTGRSLLRPPLHNEQAEPWAGQVPFDKDFVVATGLRLHKGYLSNAGKKKLRAFRPFIVS